MKIQELLENTSSYKPFLISLDYVYCNMICGYSARHKSDKFLEFYKNVNKKEIPFPGIYHITNMMPTAEKDELLKNADFKDLTIMNDGSVKSDTSFSIFGLDSFGPPPFKIKGSFAKNKIFGFDIFKDAKSLKKIEPWFPENAHSINITETGLETLSGMHKIVKSCNDLYLSGNNIKSGVLSLLLIDDLETVTFDGLGELTDIIRKYLPKGDIFACQEDLINAGYKELATT